MSDAEKPADAPVPDLMVEKLALGELDDAKAKAVRERLGDDAEARLQALARSDEEILREHPPGEVAAQVRRRLQRLDDEEERARGGGWLVWAPVAVAACVALVWWVGRGGPGDPTVDEPEMIAKAEPTLPEAKTSAGGGAPEQILLKGDPVLMIDRIVDGRAERMLADGSVAAGDMLQLKYNAKGAKQGVVVSIDGAGVATLHFPEAETGDPTLDHGGPVSLPTSYELDDAPSFERFFFVTVDETQPRLDAARVMDAARTLANSPSARDGQLPLPDSWRQLSTLLAK